jgi:glycerophosphoryl diester phosphodiesterase
VLFVFFVAQPRPLIIAHRGASAEAPENTLIAFRRALALKADGIELDVRVTRDGVPVVFHDATLRRLTGCSGRVAEMTWRELTRLRIGGTESIPRLTEVLRLARGRTVVQLELKAGIPVAPVIRAIRAARAQEWVILASFAPGMMRTARRLAPAVPRMLITEGRATPATIARQLAALDASGVSVNCHAVRDAAWIQSFQSRGYAVWSWTVNDVRTARRLAGWGIDALLGDNPALLRRTV